MVNKVVKSKRSRKTTRRSKAQKGGAVRMPSEFFGKDSGAYADTVPASYDTAYGASRGVSHGSVQGCTTGPNLAPGPNHSGMQTGGKRRLSKKGKKSQKSKTRKSSKKTSKGKSGRKSRK